MKRERKARGGKRNYRDRKEIQEERKKDRGE